MTTLNILYPLKVPYQLSHKQIPLYLAHQVHMAPLAAVPGENSPGRNVKVSIGYTEGF